MNASMKKEKLVKMAPKAVKLGRFIYMRKVSQKTLGELRAIGVNVILIGG